MLETIGYLLSLLMGVSLGLIGGGGSILTVPILVYFFSQEAQTATTGSLLIVGITSFVGAVQRYLNKEIDFKVGLTFAIPSFLGVLVTRKVLLASIPNSFLLFDQILVTKSLLILSSFALLMILASRAMIRSGAKHEINKSSSAHGIRSIGLKGFFVGCITGFVGAGGGFIIVPALVILLHLPMRKAIGTSLAIIAANSIFGFIISFKSQSLNFQNLGIIAFLGIMGLFFGSHFSTRVPEKRLKIGFGYFVLFIGLLIMFEQIYRLN